MDWNNNEKLGVEKIRKKCGEKHASERVSKEAVCYVWKGDREALCLSAPNPDQMPAVPASQCTWEAHLCGCWLPAASPAGLSAPHGQRMGVLVF